MPAIKSKETNEMLTCCHVLEVFLSACSVAQSDGCIFHFFSQKWTKSKFRLVCLKLNSVPHVFAVLLSF